jgi:hypothetical protein
MSLPRVRYNRSPYRNKELDDEGEEIEFIPATEVDR